MTLLMRKKFFCQLKVLGITLLLCIVTICRFNDIRGVLSKKENYWQTNGSIVQSEIIFGNNYSYVIKYSYLVNNKKYINSKVTFRGSRSVNKSYAQNYVNRYPIGKKVNVFYQKKNPSLSVLEPNVKEPELLFFPIGMFVGLFWFIWLIWEDRLFLGYQIRKLTNKKFKITNDLTK